MNQKATIIILNWNGLRDTVECLESVTKIDYPDFEIIVVDNGSTDGSAEAIINLFSRVIVIKNNANLGYAEGNNVGIRHALKNKAEFILVLNNDTVVAPDILKILVKAAHAHPEAGVFSVSIYSYSEPDEVTFTPKYWDAGKSMFVENKYELRDGAVETDYVDGCVMFFRAIVAEKTGLFEPLFFLDYEEIDWCFRVKKSGFKLLIIPAAKVWHKIRKSFGGKGPLFYYFFIRGRLLWAERNLSLLQQLHEYRLITCEFLPFLFYTRKYPPIKRAYWDLLLMIRERSILEAKLFGIRDFIFRRFGDCPAHIRRLNEKYFGKK